MASNGNTEAVESIVNNATGKMHICMPATILAFNPSKCQAIVQPDIKYYITDGTAKNYPAIANVPVFMPKAGSTQITYPVTSGDKCLLVFCDRSLDEWAGNAGIEQHDPRRNDLTDAFCFVGMCPTQSISADCVELINGGTKVSVASDAVNITGNVNIVGTVNVMGTTICTGDVLGGGISLIGHVHSYHHGTTGSSQ